MKRLLVLVAACGAPAGGPDASAPADAALVGAGTWADPKPIASLPFTDAGDTTGRPDLAQSYACKPAAAENGGEVVYQLVLAAPAYVRAAVTAAAPVDVDVHILDADAARTCIVRDDATALHQLVAGAYLIVVDTYDQHAGAYTLTVDTDTDVGACLVDPIPGCAGYPTPDVDRVPVAPRGVGGCPDGMTRVDTFCVDRWEDALVLDGPGGAQGFSPYAHPTTEPVRAISAPGVVPQAYIDEPVAQAACTRAGKRLCTNTEWLRACQGASGTTYPYGNTREPGVCNDARACHPAIQYFESTGNEVWSKLGDSCIDQLPAGLLPTGSLPGCITEDGAFDMMGNLHEWTDDPAGTFRGGFYVDTKLNGNGCLYATTAHDVNQWDYSTGFRCCADLP